MDFQQFTSDVEASYKPQCDYSALPDEALVVRLGLADCLGIQCAARILCASNPNWSPGEVLRLAFCISRNPSPENLTELYGFWPRSEPLQFLVDLRLNARHIGAELRKRSAEHKLGRALLASILSTSKEPFKTLLMNSISGGKPLWQRTRNTDKDVQNDREATAIEGAWRHFKKLKAGTVKRAKGSYLPSLPSWVKVPDAPDWLIRELSEKFKLTIEQTLRDLLPVIRGTAEEIAESAHQAVRNQDEKWSAQKRGGHIVCPNCLRKVSSKKAPKQCPCGSSLAGAERAFKEVRFGHDAPGWGPITGTGQRIDRVWSQNDERDETLRKMGLAPEEENFFLELVREYRSDESCPAEHRRILELVEEKGKKNAAEELGITRPTLDARLKEIATAILLRKK